MTFDEVLEQVRGLLQNKGRVAYRALKRRFALDDEYLEDLKAELIDAEHVAHDEDGKVLVWVGERTQQETENQRIGESEKKVQHCQPQHQTRLNHCRIESIGDVCLEPLCNNPEDRMVKDTAMAIVETLVAEPPPLYATDDGVVRITGTRVSLDTVIGAFQNGCTPEQIVYKYPSLTLADVYAVITYYLRHRQEVEADLAQQRQETEDIRQEVEERFPPHDVRERLLARRSQRS